MPRLPNCGHQLYPHLLRKRVFVAQRNKHKKAIHDGWPALLLCLISRPFLPLPLHLAAAYSRMLSSTRANLFTFFIELCGCLQMTLQHRFNRCALHCCCCPTRLPQIIHSALPTLDSHDPACSFFFFCSASLQIAGGHIRGDDATRRCGCTSPPRCRSWQCCA